MKSLIILVTAASSFSFAQSITYPIVDTDQSKFYNNTSEITEPIEGASFYGQDAQYEGNQPSYTDNGDETITDNVTGLMWQKSLPESKYTFNEAFEYAESSNLAGYTDWRIPTIKELYSLILFSGSTGNQGIGGVPYINTDYFDFRYGDEYDPYSRPIDAQYVSSNAYVETIMDGQPGVFGLNLADGRIKCYPQTKEFEVKLVRGNSEYGINDFTEYGDGTITDLATGLMWDQTGSSDGMNWENALLYVQELNSSNYLGFNDWRLPNAKELHSILDYSRSPGTASSAAIDPKFEVPSILDEDGNEDFPFYWTSTTHDDGPYPDHAVYIAFGRALGFMQFPGDSDLELYDVHGAGAQRSDPKAGDPDDYPTGFGPQGDVIRIYNYVRVVRDADLSTDVEENEEKPTSINLEQNYPNPFNPSTEITFTVDISPSLSLLSKEKDERVRLEVYNILGQKICTLFNKVIQAGTYTVNFNAFGLAGGVYLCRLKSGGNTQTKKMLLVK